MGGFILSPMESFAGWLGSQLDRQGVSRRELSRRLAAGDVRAAESQRRHLKRILSGDVRPTQKTRDAICGALGVPPEDAPSAQDDRPEPRSSDLSMLADLMVEVRALRREFSEARA